MELVIFGTVLAALAVGLTLCSSFHGEKAAQFKFSKAARVQDVIQLRKDITEDLGLGSFRDLVEVRGKPQLENPLRAELSGTPCLFYRVSITREYEETITECNGNGNSRTNTRRGCEIVYSNTQSVPFLVDDGTGTIEIRPDGAEIDLVKTVDTFEGGDPGDRISFQNLNIPIGQPKSTRQTLGYHYREHLLPIDQDVFVFGEVSETNNELHIGRPGKTGLFVISHRHKDEIIRSLEGAAKLMKVGAGASAVLGLVGVVLGIMNNL